MPKIIGTNLAEHRKRTRRRLFAALSDLMAINGFDSLTMSQIAQKAGVGRTAVYNHFADKESLLLAFIADETKHYSSILTRALAQVTDPVDQLRVYIREQLQLKTHYHLAPGPDLREIVSLETSKELREHATQVEGILESILTRCVTEGRISPQQPTTVIPLIHACLGARRMPTSKEERDEIIAATERFILRALGAPMTHHELPNIEYPQDDEYDRAHHSEDSPATVNARRATGCPFHF